MNLDDPVCLCFHVTRRKVVNYIRVEKPKRPSQLSQCFGAGTGCGWCRPYLERLLNESLSQSTRQNSRGQETARLETDNESAPELTLEQYKIARSAYVRKGGGKPPPGAEPIQEIDESSDSGPEQGSV